MKNDSEWIVSYETKNDSALGKTTQTVFFDTKEEAFIFAIGHAQDNAHIYMMVNLKVELL